MAGPLFKVGDRVKVWMGAPTRRAERFFDALGHTTLIGIFEVVAVSSLNVMDSASTGSGAAILVMSG